MRVNSHVLDAYAQRSVERPAEAETTNAANAASQVHSSAKSESSQAATLSISGEARRLAATNPPIDADRVAAVRQRIEAGEFQIDPTLIAKRILDKLA